MKIENKSIYIPSDNESNCLRSSFEVMFKSESEAILACIPNIYVTGEYLPAFDIGVEEDRDSISSNEDRPDFEGEKPMAVYVPCCENSEENEHIILSAENIYKVASKIGLDQKELLSVVLFHEIGHWLTHKAPFSVSLFWDDEKYDAATSNLHECLAQLFTYHCCVVADGKQEKDGELTGCFENLSTKQANKYQTFNEPKFKELKDKLGSLVEALVNVRKLPKAELKNLK